MIPIVYAARYQIDIGPHVFPTRKYQLVLDRLLEAGVIQPSDFIEPEPATWDDLALVHTTEYLEKMRDGRLSLEEQAQLELPWSAEMVDGFRLMVGGTIRAALLACGEEVKRRRARLLTLAWQLSSAAACITPFRATAKASVRSTMSPSPFACCSTRDRTRRGGRSGRPPRQRHGVHLRIRPARVHVLDAPAAQLPDVEAARVARHRPRRTARTTRPTFANSSGRLPLGHGPSAAVRRSISPGAIRTRTTSSAACG